MAKETAEYRKAANRDLIIHRGISIYYTLLYRVAELGLEGSLTEEQLQELPNGKAVVKILKASQRSNTQL